eukprot:11222583-Lingulodinium_polyedra.AAC.1
MFARRCRRVGLRVVVACCCRARVFPSLHWFLNADKISLFTRIARRKGVSNEPQVYGSDRSYVCKDVDAVQ